MTQQRKEIAKNKQPISDLPKWLLKPWERALTQHIKKGRSFSEIKTIWHAYTQERESLSKHLLNSKAAAQSYFIGFHLVNAARAFGITERFLKRFEWRFAEGQQLEITDLGAGTSAITAGFLASLLKHTEIQISQLGVHLVEQSRALLDIAQDVLAETLPREQVHAHKVRLEEMRHPLLTRSDEAPEQDKIHVFVMGYVWNEVTKNRRAQERILQLYATALEKKERALIVFAEPANQAQAREAMQLRDFLVETGWLPVYPCPAAIPCPLGQKPRDWCYSELNWTKPASQKRIDNILEVDRTTIAVAGYLLASPQLMLQLKAHRPQREVVVGRPQVKGNPDRRLFDYLICGPDKLHKEQGRNVQRFLQRGELFEHHSK